MAAEELSFDPVAFYNSKKQGTKSLIASFDRQSSTPKNDALINSAIKRRADAIKVTQHMIQQRLVDELDETVANHVRSNPGMTGNYYVAFIQDEKNSVEVLKLDDVVGAVRDLPPKEAEAVLRRNPMGYFQRSDFTLESDQSTEYQDLKDKVEGFLKERQAIFDFLRNHASEIANSDSLGPVL